MGRGYNNNNDSNVPTDNTDFGFHLSHPRPCRPALKSLTLSIIYYTLLSYC